MPEQRGRATQPTQFRSHAWTGVTAHRGAVPRGEVLEVIYETPTLVLTAHLSGGPLDASHRVAGRRASAPPMRTGSNTLLPAGLDVSCVSDRALAPLEFLSLQFDEAQVRAIDPDRGAPPAFAYLMNVEMAAVHSLMRQICLNLEGSEDPLGRLFLQHASIALLALAARSCGHVMSAGPRRGGLSLYVLRRVIERLGDDMDATLNLQDLADIAGLSQYHFLRCFKQSTGLPPRQWLLERRIERSKALLQTGIPVGEVAAQVGFSDPGYFAKTFRNRVGVSPTRFRRLRAK